MRLFSILGTALVVGGIAPDVSASTGAHVRRPSGDVRRVCPRPPFGGTIFVDPDIITPADPSTYTGATYTGQGQRTMYDRRVSDWVTLDAYLFQATFDDGVTSEIQVNPEFGSMAAAEIEAVKYGTVLGQLPTDLRADMATVWIHKGVEPFGGGNNNVLIHTGQADNYVASGILEETLIHEASHTSLDAYHAGSSGWLDSQAADDCFISTYARDFPTREDVAETFLLYVALRYKRDRISEDLRATILATIPNRVAYFDAVPLNLHPYGSPEVPTPSSSWGVLKSRW